MPLSPFKESSSGGSGNAAGSEDPHGSAVSGVRQSCLKKERKDRSRSPVKGDEKRTRLEEDSDEMEVQVVSHSNSVSGQIPPLPGFKSGGPLSNAEVFGHDGGDGKEGEKGEEKGKGKGKGEEGGEDKEDDPSLKSVMQAIAKVNLNIDSKFAVVDSKFSKVEAAFESLREDLNKLKESVVSHEIFQALEVRVMKLENEVGKSLNSDMASLRKQLLKLDPAHRSIRISGFVSDSHDSRINQIESMLRDLKLPNMIHAESLFKGLPGNRSLSSVCMVEFPSRTIREDVLTKLQGADFKKSSNKDLMCARAKTTFQLGRNKALHNACDLLKKDPRNRGKVVEIIWQKSDKKDRSREVQVNSEVAFLQDYEDMKGSFMNPFVDLVF